MKKGTSEDEQYVMVSVAELKYLYKRLSECEAENKELERVYQNLLSCIDTKGDKFPQKAISSVG